MIRSLAAAAAVLAWCGAPAASRAQRANGPRADGRPVILLVHGRGMLDRDTAGARRMWIDALTDGARSAARAVPFADSDIRIVWYADVLDPRATAGCTYDANDPRARRDARSDAGMKTLLSIAGGLLDVISGTVDDRESSAEVRGLAADAAFLADAHRRCAAEQRLGAALDRAKSEGRPVILVAHSLGAVVSYDYLSSRADSGLVQRFLTIGSPVGASALRQLLIGGDSTDVVAKPLSVKDWINIRHAGDQFAAPLTVARDTVVDLPADESDAHELVGYLRGRPVAREILSGWCGAFVAARPQGCNGLASK